MIEGNDNPMPINRAQHCMTSIREFLIIYGGYENNTGEDLNEISIYNTITGVWKRYQTPIEIKDTCLSSSICSNGSLIYIFGGDSFGDDSDYRQSNSLISFDIINTTWKVVYLHTDNYDENTPPPMCENLLLYHHGSIYVLGGIHDCLKLDTMYKYCLKTSTWSIVPQYGVKQTFDSQIFGTVYKNKIYCFEDQPDGTNKLRKIRIFDLSTNTWGSRETNAIKQQFPSNRIYESLAFSNNVCYMSGGVTRNTGNNCCDIWRINLESLQWSKLEYYLTTGVYDHRMSIVNDCYLYSFGGYREEGCINTLEMFILQPPTLYRSSLQSVSQTENLRKYHKLLPVAISDELNLNDIN